MSALLLTVALVLSQDRTIMVKQKLENPVLSKQKEKQELIEKLRRDIFKVNRSLGETDKLIAKSRNAPYLPDLMFRQAELYVEKSRYTYYLQAETRPEGAKGAMVSPETKLLKQRAQQIYNRILRDFPEFKDGDKVTFYLAHEQRELGEFDNMLKTLGDLIRKYPSSPLRLDSEQIIGDYWFDKADLKQAEEHFKNILDAPNSPVHDLARYKMGWIRINEAKHGDAVTYFEAAAASAPIPGVDPAKSLNVKREALLDLVYSYTEARPAKGALQYFEKLSDSRATSARKAATRARSSASAITWSTSGCSGASTAYVMPNTVSGRVVNTRIFSSERPATGRSNSAPSLLPIQLRCIVLTRSGQSPSRAFRVQAVACHHDPGLFAPHQEHEVSVLPINRRQRGHIMAFFVIMDTPCASFAPL